MQAWIRGDNYAQSQFIGDRSNQEDSAEITLLQSEDDCLLVVLSDGMGGHEAGEIASQIAVKTFRTTFHSFNAKSFEGRLYAAMQASNAEIARSIAERKQLQGMGCTLVGAVVSNGGLSWASVGDSPLYLFRDGRLTRLNEDHSMLPVLEKLALEGRISREELAHHPQRNSLRSAVTGERLDLIDTSSEPYWLLKDDVIICASDGLLTLSETEIKSLLMSLQGRTAADVSDSLIAAVKEKARPRQDNVSVQVLQISSARRGAAGRWRKVVVGVLLIAAILISAGILLVGNWFGASPKPYDQKEATRPITPMIVQPPVLKEEPQKKEDATPKVDQTTLEKAPPDSKPRREGESDPARKKQKEEQLQKFETPVRGDGKAPESNATPTLPAPPSAPKVGGTANGQANRENPPVLSPLDIPPSPSGPKVPSAGIPSGSLSGEPSPSGSSPGVRSDGAGAKKDGSSDRAPDAKKGPK